MCIAAHDNLFLGASHDFLYFFTSIFYFCYPIKYDYVFAVINKLKRIKDTILWFNRCFYVDFYDRFYNDRRCHCRIMMKVLRDFVFSNEIFNQDSKIDDFFFLEKLR